MCQRSQIAGSGGGAADERGAAISRLKRGIRPQPGDDASGEESAYEDRPGFKNGEVSKHQGYEGGGAIEFSTSGRDFRFVNV
jgi:hypothetical protein